MHSTTHLLKREVQKRNFLNKEYLFREWSCENVQG